MQKDVAQQGACEWQHQTNIYILMVDKGFDCSWMSTLSGSATEILMKFSRAIPSNYIQTVCRDRLRLL
jgi:hypothetical protein